MTFLRTSCTQKQTKRHSHPDNALTNRKSRKYLSDESHRIAVRITLIETVAVADKQNGSASQDIHDIDELAEKRDSKIQKWRNPRSILYFLWLPYLLLARARELNEINIRSWQIGYNSRNSD